jgi:ubiquinone/menaquinone biosynthesis C-methylase UbiE
MSVLTPLRFVEAVGGYQRTAVAKAAIELDIFTIVDEGANTVPEIAGLCHASVKGVRVLCDALTVLGMLRKEGSMYRLTPESQLFLSRRSPRYVGDMVFFHTAPDHLAGFESFTEAVRRGGTAVEAQGTGKPENPLWNQFARTMGNMMHPAALKIADLAGDASKVLDLAAGHGRYGIEIAKRNPAAQVWALDWPQVLEQARIHVQEAGVEARWHAMPGDAFTLPWSQGNDVIIFGNFLHMFDLDSIATLARLAHGALAPDGVLLTLEHIPEEDRVTPSAPAWFAAVMLANTTGGDAYTFSEYETVLQAAGFAPSELHTIEGSAQRIIASRKLSRKTA